MLKERTTYEIMRPEDVGLSKTDLVLGKHSGRAALADRAKALGYQLSAEQLQTVFEQFKDLADKKKEVYDADLAALIDEQMRDTPDMWAIDNYRLITISGTVPSVRLSLKRGDEVVTVDVNAGDGPFDALFWAIEQITGINVVCRNFNVHSVTRRQGRPGRSDRRSRTRRPFIPRPRRLHRQHPGQRQGLSECDQSHHRHRRPAHGADQSVRKPRTAGHGSGYKRQPIENPAGDGSQQHVAGRQPGPEHMGSAVRRGMGGLGKFRNARTITTIHSRAVVVANTR